MTRLLSAMLLLVFAAALPAIAQQAAVSDLRVAQPDVIPIPPPPNGAFDEQPLEEPVVDESGDDAPPADDATPDQPAKPVEPGVLRFHLMDGTVITGKLTTDTLPVSTEFGDLSVPITKIVSFAPGLQSHPEINKTINTLIKQLGDPQAKVRDKAQASLIAYGPGLVSELQTYADDPDAERKVRIATITEELLAVEEDEFTQDDSPSVSLRRLDEVVTQRFTIAGKIEQDTFNIASKFGELTVKLADITAVEIVSTDKPEVRRTVAVTGMDMTCRGYKKTGIRVNRGDRILISADGRVTMSPWGSNSVSTPDGNPQSGMYKGKIPMGALAGRIGDSGEEMLIGSKKSFVAKKSGVLQLGFAMQQNWANYQFPGEYKVRVRVVPAN
jgi:hypothetical protein